MVISGQRRGDGEQSDRKARAVVTGAAGFIGSNLVDRLLDRDYEVIGVDNLSTGRLDNLGNALATRGLKLACIDVTSAELRRLVVSERPDMVFHLAAQVDLRASVSDPAFDARSNVLGTINVCEAVRQAGVQRVVYTASGGSRYGLPSALPVSEKESLAPLSPYAVSKLAGELYLGAYAGMYGIAPICLALGNVYGPRQNPHGEAGVIGMFGAAALNGRQSTIFGDGSSTRDYVYVGDVVDALVLAGEAPLTTTGTFNIGTGSQTTVAEIHRLISAATDQSDPPLFSASRTGELEAIALDCSAAGETLGWRPGVAIDEGIRHTVGWLRSHLTDIRPASPPGGLERDLVTQARTTN